MAPSTLRVLRIRSASTRSDRATRTRWTAATDAFVISGTLHSRASGPLLGAEKTVTGDPIPVECGLVQGSCIRVRDRRSGVVQIAREPELDSVHGLLMFR